MKINGIDAELIECVAAVDGSCVWRNGVKYVPETLGAQDSTAADVADGEWYDRANGLT